jgi:ankyrin repeat protein
VDAKTEFGNTALIWAASEGHTAIVELLLAAQGIHVNAKDVDGWTALIWAAEEGHAEIVRLLLAVPGIHVNAKNNNGETALMVAEREGHTDVVRAINSFFAAQAMNRWIPRHRSRQRDRVGLRELDSDFCSSTS